MTNRNDHGLPDLDRKEERDLVEEIMAELNRAREKFPGDNVTALALVEEVGETATALFEEPRDAVRKEAIQTAVMAMRLILDGDATLRLWRALRGLDPLIEGDRLDGAASIAMERQRQITDEGWTADHDDDPRRNLVKAGALIAAEIDRLDRRGSR